CLLPLLCHESGTALLAHVTTRVVLTSGEKDHSSYITCDGTEYCVQNITHTENEMWLIGGCGNTDECQTRLDNNTSCVRGSAIEKTHPSLYHFSCCSKGDEMTNAWRHFFRTNNSGFLRKTASQSLPRVEVKAVIYVRTAVAALFAIAAIATQIVAVRLYRKKQE
ncbi:hypothetical protein PMAYCL1PPCAC_11841, partial [Pristionchus mayeri]